MKLGHCTILGAVEGVPDADIYEVALDETGQRLVVRITSRAVPPFSDAAGESERFLADAAPFAALEHPNVLPLVDYGEQVGLRFLIEPYVGQTMLDYLTSGQPLPQPVPVARRVVADAAAGLQYLHDRGLVHGQVNVRSLYLQPTTHDPVAPSASQTAGQVPFHVLVGDFGLRRYLDEGVGADDSFAEFVAPEQHHDAATAASDQYALAVLAHLLLTGRLPVISSRSQPIEDISPGDLVPPSQLNPALPAAIDFLLNTALQPVPEQRFRRISDLATALDIATGAAPAAPLTAPPPAPRADGTLAPVAPPLAAAPSAPAPATASVDYPTFPPPDRAPVLAASAPLAPPPTAPAPNPVYLLPKAPPYTEPVRAVKPLKVPTPQRTPGGMRLSRRTLLLGAAGGVAGVALLGGAGYYFFLRPSGPAAPDSLGVFRPARASFLLLSSLAARQADLVVPFGQRGDLPIAGDWDGTGLDSPGVFRPSTGAFYLAGDNSAAPRLAHTLTFGQSGDLPIAGDWTGSGRDGVGVFRPSTARFLLKHTLNPGPPDVVLAFGVHGDLPVAGDWTGSGHDGIGLFRASDATFYLLDSASAQSAPVANHHVPLGIGAAAGWPLAGDWQRAGHSGVGLFVPASRTVYLKQSLTSASAPDRHLALGEAGDLPVAGRWR
jgi:serine/threonine protein kinase